MESVLGSIIEVFVAISIFACSAQALAYARSRKEK